MRPPRAYLRIVVLGMALVVRATHARAADDLQPRVNAEALFREGLRLIAAGRVAEACPKLAESQRLEPAAGTLLNLGGCYDKLGKIASAWLTFKDAINAARARGRADWEALARRKVAELEPKLPRLRIVVPPESDVRDLAIDRDGAAVGRGELDVAIPVDPGVHTISASAPGRTVWQTSVDAVPGQAIDVPVPALPLAASSPTSSAAPPEPAVARTEALNDGAPVDTRRFAEYVTFGAGGAGVAFGIVTGLLAVSAKSGCTPYPNCASSAGGPDANDRAHTWATVSTVSVVVGAALIVAGLTLVLTASKPARAAVARSY